MGMIVGRRSLRTPPPAGHRDGLRAGHHAHRPTAPPPTCPTSTGKTSSTGLLSWYYAWGGAMDNAWSWRIGSSHNHGGYQNPLAAWAMSPAGPTAIRPQYARNRGQRSHDTIA